MTTTRLRNSNPYPLRIDTGANHKSISLIAAPSQKIQAPKTQRPASQVQIRHLDGTPYGMNPRSRKTIVAKDVYDGQEPPQYKSKASYPDLRQPSVSMSQPSDSCRTCGKQMSSTNLSSHPPNSHDDCNTCGKQKVVTPEPAQTILPPPQIRSVSEASSSTLINVNDNSSTDSITPAPKKKCVRCGRAKKPTSSTSTPAHTANVAPALQRATAPNGLSFPIPPPTTHIAAQHMSYMSTQSSARPASNIPRRKLIPPQLIPGYKPSPELLTTIDIDIIPPTAISEHAQPNPLRDDPTSISHTPLISQQQSPPKPRRSTSITSIASSITRSLTRRRRSNDSTTSTTAPEHNGNNAGRLINMISNAIRGDQDSSYTRLNGIPDRRATTSPFSFVSKTDDNTAMELPTLPHPSSAPIVSADLNTDINPQPRPSTISSTTSETTPKQNPFADPTATNPEQKSLLASLSRVTAASRSTSLTTSQTAPVLPTLSTIQPPPIPQDDIYLSTRPTDLTRFKSLRSNVSRAGSVARSNSLKRLGSLKAAPQLWYRTDMAIEGAVGVY